MIPPDYDPTTQNIRYLAPIDFGSYLFVPLEITDKELCKEELQMDESLLPF